MTKLIDKDMQQKIALGVIVYIIAFVIFNNIVIEKINKKTKETKQRVELLKMDNSQALVKIANINTIKERYNNKLVEYEDGKRAFLNENEKKVILKQIEEAGKMHNIKIETISLTRAEASITTNLNGEPVIDESGSEIDMTKYKEYRIMMTFRSNYSDLTEYIKEIESLEKLVLIHQLTLNSDGKEISGKMLLKCYLVESGGV